MRLRTRSTHLNGVRTRNYEYVTRQRKGAKWLQKLYRMHVSPFSLKVDATRSFVETAYKGIDCSTVRIELWRARIRTGCYQVNGQALAACILTKEAHFWRL
jgi:hypothetical protein